MPQRINPPSASVKIVFSRIRGDVTMPIYEYRCSSCGHQQEFLQKVSDAPVTVCTQCGKETFTKMLTAAGFQLKGSGWYATDFKNSGGAPAKAKAADAKPAESKPAAEAKSDGGKESSAPAAATPSSGTPSTGTPSSGTPSTGTPST
jgi:putative FmdB family regulatory protein